MAGTATGFISLAFESSKMVANGELNYNKQIDTTKAIIDILQGCFAARNWKDLNVQIGRLCTGISKQGLQAVVQHAIQYIVQAPDRDAKIELITTLIGVTVREKCLHIERARLIKKLAKIKENQGHIDKAANLMKTIVVEKIKTMDKIEKITLILEQVRLFLDCQDYEHARRLSTKINPRDFQAETNGKSGNGDQHVVLFELQKIYNELMIRYHSHTNDYLDVFRCYKAIYEIPFVKEDPGQWMPVLLKMCWYLVLAPYDSVQSGLIDSILKDKNLLRLPKCRLLLKRFATMAIIEHEGFMCSRAFSSEFSSEIYFLGHSFSEKANDDFQKRVAEHNILVASTYNRRLELLELAMLVQEPCEYAERILCEMIDSNSLTAKFHKPSKMVYFPNADDSREALDARARMLNEHREFLWLVSFYCVNQFSAFADAVIRSMQNQRQFSLCEAVSTL